MGVFIASFLTRAVQISLVELISCSTLPRATPRATVADRYVADFTTDLGGDEAAWGLAKTGCPWQKFWCMEKNDGRSRWLRLAAALGLVVLLLVLGHQSGLAERLSVEGLRAHVEEAGMLGVAAFVVAFAVGELLHLPGMLFVGAGVLAFGKALGFAVSLFAAIVAVSLSFVIVRAVGGQALAGVDRPLLKRMMVALETRPITTVLLLRTIFWLAPPLNYALALSSVRLSDYVIGSALGLVTPILSATLFFEWIFA
jgi:uncharacterized membrane protein YdjX (TVP38/TMEM64 family)